MYAAETSFHTAKQGLTLPNVCFSKMEEKLLKKSSEAKRGNEGENGRGWESKSERKRENKPKTWMQSNATRALFLFLRSRPWAIVIHARPRSQYVANLPGTLRFEKSLSRCCYLSAFIPFCTLVMPLRKKINCRHGNNVHQQTRLASAWEMKMPPESLASVQKGVMWNRDSSRIDVYLC